MRVLRYLWSKLIPCRAVKLTGTRERLFCESVYRLSFLQIYHICILVKEENFESIYIKRSGGLEETMRAFYTLWRKLTPSSALDLAGPLEKAFFESVYRLAFFLGLSTSDNYKAYKIYCTVMRIITVLLVCFETWRLTDDLTKDEFIFTTNVVFVHLMTIWKLKTMLSNKDTFKKLEKAFESPGFDISTQTRKDIVSFWAKTHKKYMKILLSLVYSTLVVWGSYTMIDGVQYNLMLEIKLPYKYDSPIRFCITYVTVGLTFTYVSMLVVMTEVMVQAHLIPLICQYDVLADCFKNLFEECAIGYEGLEALELVKDKTFKEKYLKRLGVLVSQHQDILAQTIQLKAVLGSPMLGQLTCSGLIICFVGYQAITTIDQNLGKFFMTFLYLACNMFSLYLLCRWCEEITVQSERIGESAYFSGWENGMSKIPGVRAAIMLVIARANKPMVFLAGGMYPLSLSSYSNLVKCSYSGLNILLSTNSNK